jgi:hypothetical protein
MGCGSGPVSGQYLMSASIALGISVLSLLPGMVIGSATRTGGGFMGYIWQAVGLIGIVLLVRLISAGRGIDWADSTGRGIDWAMIGLILLVDKIFHVKLMVL